MGSSHVLFYVIFIKIFLKEIFFPNIYRINIFYFNLTENNIHTCMFILRCKSMITKAIKCLLKRKLLSVLKEILSVKLSTL